MATSTKDFSDPKLGPIKNDILGMLTGPLAAGIISPESAMQKIRAACYAEYPFNTQDFMGMNPPYTLDELVSSMPEWIRKYGSPEEKVASENEIRARMMIHNQPPKEGEAPAPEAPAPEKK
jgi:hypothetical protein